MSLQPGTLLHNRYTIVEPLTHGGMGAIYRANDESLNVVVAVKENLFTTDEYSRQFHREASILAALRHSNLPRVTDHFVITGQGQYLVMDFIEGEDLRQRLQRAGAVPEEEVILMGVAICEAVAYLHNHEPLILHRDIKPGNIKITPKGQVYLVDFGLARMVQAGQATTIGAQALTPGFAPPEQYGHGTDTRSDIYALGATLYTALTDVTPEDGLSRALGGTHLTPIRQRRPEITENTASVIEKAMAVDPKDRYQTADEFKLALLNANTAIRRRAAAAAAVADQATTPKPAVNQEPTVAISGKVESAAPASKPVGSTGPAKATRTAPPIVVEPVPSQPRQKKKNLWIVFALLAVLFVGVIGIGALLLSGIPAKLIAKAQTSSTPAVTATPASTATPLPAAVDQPSPTNTAAPTRTEAPSPTIPPPTETLAPTKAPATETPVPTITPTSGPTPLGGGSGEVLFSSNRAKSERPQLWLMDSNGKNLKQITKVSEGACQGAWSPDGKRIVYVSPCITRSQTYPGSSLFVMNIDGSDLISISETTVGDFDPSWSPDGTMIAFTSLRDTRPHIYIYNFTDQTTKLISPGPIAEWQPVWSPDGTRIAFVSTRQSKDQIYTMKPDGTDVKEVTTIKDPAVQNPIWSPDMKTMLFTPATGISHLWGLRTDGTSLMFNIGGENFVVYDASYSADGIWLFFEGISWGQYHDIYRMTKSGTQLQRITDDEGLNFAPAWRPASK